MRTDDHLRRAVYGADLLEWADLLCSARGCAALADALLDSQPVCLDCADLLLERAVAVAICPELRTTLPPLWER